MECPRADLRWAIGYLTVTSLALERATSSQMPTDSGVWIWGPLMGPYESRSEALGTEGGWLRVHPVFQGRR
jgi:hypothetical protein